MCSIVYISLFFSTWKIIIIIKTFCVLSFITYWILRSMIFFSFIYSNVDDVFLFARIYTLAVDTMCPTTTISVVVVVVVETRYLPCTSLLKKNVENVCSATNMCFFLLLKYYEYEEEYILIFWLNDGNNPQPPKK